MQVETWPPSKLTPYPGNPRKIGPKAISKVAESIKEFGFQQPIVVDPEGVIIVASLQHGTTTEDGLPAPVSLPPPGRAGRAHHYLTTRQEVSLGT